MWDAYLIWLSYSYSTTLKDLFLQKQGKTTSGLKTGYWGRVLSMNLSMFPLEFCVRTRNQRQILLYQDDWSLIPVLLTATTKDPCCGLRNGHQHHPPSSSVVYKFTNQHSSIQLGPSSALSLLLLFRYELDFLSNVEMTRRGNVFQNLVSQKISLRLADLIITFFSQSKSRRYVWICK